MIGGTLALGALIAANVLVFGVARPRRKSRENGRSALRTVAEDDFDLWAQVQPACIREYHQVIERTHR